MYRHITADDIEVQVEAHRTDVWVPDGLAVERRNYPRDGIKFDAANGLAFAEQVSLAQPSDPDWLSVSPTAGRTAPPVTDIETSTGSDGNGHRFVDRVTPINNVSIGPVLTQNRIPVPVSPGMRVDWGGTFKLRTTGTIEKTSDGDPTMLAVRVELFGTGTATDEYGVSTELTVPLKTYMRTLQSGQRIEQLTYELPTGEPVEVPADVDSVYLTVSLYGTGDYQTGSYRVQRWGWWGTAPLPWFVSPKITSGTAQPLTIYVHDPANTHPTHPHPRSRTGFAFADREVFEVPPVPVEVTVLAPVTGEATTVQVHTWDGLDRGALLATIAVPAGGRTTAVVTSSTGALALSSPGSYAVESVLAQEIDTRTVEQTRLHRYEYVTVTEEVNTIRTGLLEADLGVSTIRFVSDTVDARLAAGRRVRVLALHPGGHAPLVSAPVRARRKVQTLRGRTQVEIALHDSWSALAAACPVSYDQLAEYGMIVHRLGVPVSIDGVDFTGPAGPPPPGHAYFPSYHSSGQSMREALLMTRNARCAFLFVDRTGRLQITSELPDTIDLEVSDMPGQGDMSYSDQLDLTTDTSNLITTVQVVEHMLDREDYRDGRVLTSSDPPFVFGPIKAKVQRIDYRRPDAIEKYGETKVSLPVVRGSGTYADINADNFGPPLRDWAASILEHYAVERPAVPGLTLPVRRRDIPAVAVLQPFSAVAVRYSGQTEVARVREVRHTISFDGGPGGATWLTELDFTVGTRGLRALWLPAPPDLDDPPVIGGFYNSAGQGSYDGGAPVSTGIGTIDGGEL